MALLAHWRMDGLPSDSLWDSAGSYHLAPAAASAQPSGIAGKLGGARRFFATTSTYAYGSVDSAFVNALKGSYSQAFWVRRSDAWAANNYVFHAKGHVGTAEQRNVLLGVFFTSAGALSLIWEHTNQNAATQTTAVTLANDATWHHVAFTLARSGADAAIACYFDGAHVGTLNVTHAISGGDGSPAATLGAYRTTVTLFHLTGDLDDYRFYDSVLSAAEVAALYNAGVYVATVSLSTLRTRVRSRCDQVNSTFVTDSELNAFVNAGADELHDILAQAFGDDYAVSSSSFTTVAGTSAYALPSDFYKLLGVDLTLSAYPVALQAFQFKERNAYRASDDGGTTPRFRLEGSNLRLYPAPQGAYAGTLWYVPQRTQLAADGDTLTVHGPGWEDYVVVDAAIRCVQKEEGDVSVLMAQKEALRRRIEEAAHSRNADEPWRVTDVDKQYVGRDDWWR